MSVWGGRRVQRIRAHWADEILLAWASGRPLECGAAVCVYPSRALGPASSWDVGHGTAKSLDPDRMWDPTNHHPEHVRCNRRDGARIAQLRKGAKRERAWL